MEVDLALSQLRERTSTLDLAVQHRFDELAQRAGEVVEHLAAFPEVSDAVRAVE